MQKKQTNHAATRESCIESSAKHGTKADVYDIVNERILELLDGGVNPWVQPWMQAARRPQQNLISRRPYRGVNTILLGFSPYASPYWLTYKQAAQLGGSVRKGEKSTRVVFWKVIEDKDLSAEGKNKQRPLLRYYSLFNAEQCEGIEVPEIPVVTPLAHQPIAAAEAIVAGMPNPPTINTPVGVNPHYRPATDTINLPPLGHFLSPEEYYGTLFHELVHSTGHASRLDRLTAASFGSTAYGREELVAEMGAAYLNGLAGIFHETANNSAAYLDSWRSLIKADKRAVVVAAGAAQKAVQWITREAAEQAAA
jgi:antirestriction protein ArdC